MAIVSLYTGEWQTIWVRHDEEQSADNKHDRQDTICRLLTIIENNLRDAYPDGDGRNEQVEAIAGYLKSLKQMEEQRRGN